MEKLMLKTLVREPVKVVEDNPIATVEKALLARAWQEFKYYPRAAYQDQQATEMGKLLSELGIEPFTPESVKTYKAKALNAAKGWKRFTPFGDEYRWKRYELGALGTGVFHPHYLEPIPAFVLSHALEIKARLPYARFFVDAIADRHELERIRVVDPFLVVEHDGNEYYIDVWDEPKFEGRRIL